MPNSNRCVRCHVLIDAGNDSEEHVIPNSIGGRLKVRGFICVKCNSVTGRTWDHAVSEQLNFLSLLFGIARDRGDAKPEPIETTAGEKLMMQPGGGFMMQKPEFKVVPTADGAQIQMSARTMGEARKMLKGVARKYPSVDPDAELAKAVSAYKYPEGVLHHSPTFGGEMGGRSIVKTAVAFAYHAGISTDQCDLALAYLRGPAEPPFGFYYERDLVAGRPAGVPIHCVAVMANPETGLLLGYLEYFGVQRVVACLSRSYAGAPVEFSYGLNPMTGERVDVRVDVSFSAEDVESIYRYEKVSGKAISQAFADVVEPALARSFEQEKARAIADATEYAFANCGAKEGEMLTDEQKARIPKLITERLQPFLRRHAGR